MSQHIDQVASVLRRAIQEVIAEGLHDPRVRGMISVTAVRVSPDEAEAFVMVSILPEEQTPRTMHGLVNAAGHIRSRVSRRVRMRRVPRLEFRLDESLKREASVLRAITEACRDEEPGPDPDASAGGEEQQS
jgi:ribosome-binding factor A